METNKYQVLTSLPNANDKHIDYVLVYRNIADDDTKINRRFKRKCIENRKRFFERLEKETFEIKKIQMDDEKNEFVYALLHCSTERLLKEAEYTNLEMKLKKTSNENNLVPVEVEQKGLKKLAKNLNRPLKDDGTGHIKSYRYDSSIRFIFEGVDDPTKPQGPFNNTTRMLLVSNILNNLVYRSVNQGLSYMLDNKYIDDAFILHDQTADKSHLRNVFSFVTQTLENNELSKDFIKDYMSTVRNFKQEDTRKKLNEKWARFRNFFRMQPMWDIRNYFGEEYALYFSWMGTFVLSLWIIGLIGLGLCLVGILVTNVGAFSSLSASLNATTSTSDAIDTIFKSTFDNNVTPLFAFALCIWGIIFVEYWKRENVRLAYEWDVEKFEQYEPDLPEYKRRQAEMKDYLSRKGKIGKFLFINIDPIKRFISFLIILFLLAIVCLEIGALVLYRIYFSIIVFPNNSTYKLIVADIGSTLINTIFIMVVQFFYTKLAKLLTKWENHRNLTEFQDALVIKLFIFNFINNYGSLFYLAYFRNISFPNGLFGLGPVYTDSCTNSNCMSLLSVQVLILLLLQPLPRFFTTVILPAITEKRKKKQIDQFFSSPDNESIQSQNGRNKNFDFNNEKAVLLYLSIEKAKSDPSETIIDEFTEKVIIYGYLILFSASFSLGPLLVLLTYLFDIRIDGKRLLWLFRRPIGLKAQDIGSWYAILKCLTIIGIVNNGFLLAFTSNWSQSFFSTNTYRFGFAIAFEHALFVIWFLIVFFSPEIPDDIKEKMKEDTVIIKKIIKEAKHKEDAKLEDEQGVVDDLMDIHNMDDPDRSFAIDQDQDGDLSMSLPNTNAPVQRNVKNNTVTPQNV